MKGINHYTLFATMQMDRSDIYALIGIVLMAVAAIAGIITLIFRLLDRRTKLRANYRIIWKNSKKLKPTDVLDFRGQENYGFKKYYYERDMDAEIAKRITQNEHTLIIGAPLAGKTRAVYQSLANLKQSLDLIIPHNKDFDTEHLRIPYQKTFWRKPVLFLDDIDKITSKNGFDRLLQLFMNKSILIIATCRLGPEYDFLKTKLERELIIFKDPIEIHKMDTDEGEKIAREVGTGLSKDFDGNIGSIFLPIESMRDRYKQCDPDEKCILKAIKRLYYAGIYSDNISFNLEHIKILCKKEGIEKKDYEWHDILEKLDNLDLIEVKNGDIFAEETYIERVIDITPVTPLLDNLKEMIEIFSSEPDTLLKAGDHACNIGLIDVEKASYMKIAIDAYNRALKVYTIERFPMYYAITQNNLGNAYVTLAEVEDKLENCSKAITAFNESLRVRTIDRFPMDYAMTQNNLGTAYGTLADVEDKHENCLKAITAFNESLRVRTIERFPMDYAMTQNNLGNAYRTLAEVEDKLENCSKAITAFNESLRVYIFERFPIQYAMTQNNLGNAYVTLPRLRTSLKTAGRRLPLTMNRSGFAPSIVSPFNMR